MTYAGALSLDEFGSLCGASAGGAAATPISIAAGYGITLVDWWRADAGTATGATASWTGQHNGYVLSQSTGANQPALNATGWNASQPCWTFDGSSDFLENAATAALFNAIDGDDVLWWAVAALRANAVVDGSIAGWTNASNHQARVRTTNSAGGRIGINHADASLSSLGESTTTIGTTRRHVGVCRTSATAHATWVDGTKETFSSLSNIGSLDFTAFRVGGNIVAQYFNGDIAELVVGLGVLPDAMYSDLRTNSATRWTGLP